MRQVEARNRGFGGELDRTVRIEAFLHPRLRWSRWAGVSSDPGNDPITTTCAVQILFRERAAQLQPAIRGSDPGTATLHLDGPEKSIDPTAHNILHSARPTVARIPRQPDPQAVTVHDSAHLWRGDENAVLQSLDAQETVAGAIRAYRPFDGAARLGGRAAPVRFAFAASAMGPTSPTAP
jgi:hypothetical protein